MFPLFNKISGGVKEPAQKQIEPRALEIKMFRLHRKIQCEDLFAKEAKYLPSCHTAFNLQYANFGRNQSREIRRSLNTTWSDDQIKK